MGAKTKRPGPTLEAGKKGRDAMAARFAEAGREIARQAMFRGRAGYEAMHPSRSRQAIAEGEGTGLAAVASACALGLVVGLAISAVVLPRSFAAVAQLLAGGV